MAFIKPVLNTAKKSIKDAYIYLRATSKFGKTTLFKDMILAKYGDPTKGLLVQVGSELGASMMSDVQTTHVETYKDVTDMVNWLISTKGTEHNIEIVAIDTIDELIGICDKEICRLGTLENPTKPCKSILAYGGGFNRGPAASADLIKATINKLRAAGFGIVVIGHTRLKALQDKGVADDTSFMQLTGAISGVYERCICDTADIIVTGDTVREFDTVTEGEVERKYLKAEERRLYLRGTTMIDAGGRFSANTVPEYITVPADSLEFAKLFIKTVEDGMNASARSAVSVASPVVEALPTPATDIDAPVDVIDDDEFEADYDTAEHVAQIRVAFRAASTDVKAKVKAYLNGSKLSDDMPRTDVEAIEKLLGL